MTPNYEKLKHMSIDMAVGILCKYNKINRHESIILKLVSEHTGLEIDEIKTKSRKREYVFARYMCYYLLRKYTKLSLVRCGQLLGGFDHSSVIHGIEEVEYWKTSYLTVDKEMAKKVKLMEYKLSLYI